MEKSTEMVRYNFSPQERVDLTIEHVRYYNELKAAEDQLNSVKADHKNTVMKLEADMNKCAQRVTSGYEMRNIPCLILKARPDNESLLIVRTDNGRVLKRRKMNADERQIKISAEPPEVFEFEVDLYDDADGDIAVEVASEVPLTKREAHELKDVEGLRIRPLMKKLESGKKDK